MKSSLSKAAREIPPSGIRVFFDMVLGMKDVVSLGVGEPDFVTPWHIRERAIDALENGCTSYTSNKGMIELRSDLSRFLKAAYDLSYDPEEEILITVGTSEALDLALRALIDPGDRILVPEPCYVSYGPITTLCRGTPVLVPTAADTGFKVRPRHLDGLCDRRSKAFVLCYPNNPTGTSYTRAELAALARVVSRRGLMMISDEIYSDLSYEGRHTPFATLPGMRDRTIYINGFSKGYAMTGWRIGYVCGPAAVIAAMTKIHQYTMLCAPVVAQIAASEAVRNGERSVGEMRREYRRRRGYVIARLNEMGLPCHLPEGAFYAFPSIAPTGLSSDAFATRLLAAEKVAVVPGAVFGPSGEGHIRISYASSMDKLKEALDRMERFLQTTRIGALGRNKAVSGRAR